MHPQQSARRWKLVAAVIVLTLCYWTFMFIATHLPAKQVPGGVSPKYDKIEHLTGFALLGVLLCTIGAIRGSQVVWTCTTVLVVVALYGVIDELTQSFSPGRTPDLRDWQFNMFGAAIGVGIFCLARLAGRTTRALASASAP
jgi:VanZ family protein